MSDVLVVGAGAAGAEAALTSARLGSQVTLVYAGELGGTCVNAGCVPSNALLHAAATRRAGFDIEAAHTAAGRVVNRVRDGVRRSLAAAGVHLLAGRLSFQDAHTATVAGPDGEIIVTADRIVIATGATTYLPAVGDVGDRRVITSADALGLGAVPARAVVVVGGHLGLEWATLLRHAGTQVTVIDEQPTLRAVADAEVAEFVAGQLGVTVLVGSPVAAVKPADDEVLVSVADQEIGADLVLFADFRRPNTDGLGLDRIGVRVDDSGAVVVDDELRTTAPGISAAGDVTGGLMLAAEARVEGGLAAANLHGGSTPMRRDLVPRALHTDPEVASVGLTESQARDAGRPPAVGYAEYAGNARALVLGADGGVVKLVVDPVGEEILGATVVGPDAASTVALVALAMQAELTASDLIASNHAHPAVGELVVDAARAALAG
ncbi:MAG TPA: FAD-dependent oxidoreductase [Pseudonocardiaceae bacterium]|nr:FAD-dependent oxidoreductase [Pseudonocardiaceae bacterium]